MAISGDVGPVATLWRFPVKAMAGEQLQDAQVTERGVLGDRAYALIDKDTGKVVSAKSVRLFPNLLDCKAAFVEPPRRGGDLPAVQMLLPDSTTVRSDSGEVDRVLSVYFKHNVTLGRAAPDELHHRPVPPRRRGRRPRGQQRHGCRAEAWSSSFCRAWNGVPGSCRFFLRCVSPLGPDDVDACAARRGSAREPLRPAQVPHERDRQDGAAWIRRKRLGRSRARVWWWGTAQRGATRSPMCDDDACSGRSTPGYGCSSDTRWPQPGASRRSRQVPLRWGLRRGRCGGNSTGW